MGRTPLAVRGEAESDELLDEPSTEAVGVTAAGQDLRVNVRGDGSTGVGNISAASWARWEEQRAVFAQEPGFDVEAKTPTELALDFASGLSAGEPVFVTLRHEEPPYDLRVPRRRK